jgi:RND family efflux transporter MFP subunit
MNVTLRRTLIGAGSALAALTAGIAFASDAKARKDPETARSVATPVQLAPVRAVRSTPHDEITGSLNPAKALQLGFEVGGRLAKVTAVRGAAVREGQVVGQLDAEVVEAQVAQAEAALQAAQVQAAQARDTADRQGKLQQGGSISEWQSKTAESGAKAAEAQVLAAKAALQQARAARARHTLRAPFAATVIEAPDQIGATVGPGASLFTLEQLDTLLLKITVPESARDQLRVGAPVRVEAISGSAQTDAARIRAIIPSADSNTRRVPVEILVPNKDHRFTAHTLARALLTLGDAQAAAAVPSTALSSTGGDHVFVLAGSGAVRRVAVTVLDRGASEVVVQGLGADAKVIDYPGIDLSEGAQVQVKQ